MPVVLFPVLPAPPCDQTPTLTFAPAIFAPDDTLTLPYPISGYSDPPNGRTIGCVEVYLNGTRSVLNDVNPTNQPRHDFVYDINEFMVEEPGVSNLLTFIVTDNLGCRTTFSTSFRT